MSDVRFVVTELILAEVVHWFRASLRDAGASAAQARDSAVNEGRRVVSSWRTILSVPTVDEAIAALEEQEGLADPKVSYVDCVSFAVMRRLGVREAFTFDRHFREAGFRIIP